MGVLVPANIAQSEVVCMPASVPGGRDHVHGSTGKICADARGGGDGDSGSSSDGERKERKGKERHRKRKSRECNDGLVLYMKGQEEKTRPTNRKSNERAFTKRKGTSRHANRRANLGNRL